MRAQRAIGVGLWEVVTVCYIEKEVRKSLSDEVTSEQRPEWREGRSQAIIWKTSPCTENGEKSRPLQVVLSWEMWTGLRRAQDVGKAVFFSGGNFQGGLLAEGHLLASLLATGGLSVSIPKDHLGGSSHLPSSCVCFCCLFYYLIYLWRNKSLPPKNIC